MEPGTKAEPAAADTKPEPEEDWQNDCRGLNQRYLELWRRGVWTDCTFVVGESGTQVLAHRVVLSAASPVFATMFYGSMHVPDLIDIHDMEIGSFKLMLEYIYTDNITVQSCEEACSLYYGAHKYMLTHLQAICKAFLLSNVSPTTVFSVYQMAQLFDEKDIAKKCLEVMSNNTSAVLETGNPMEADLESLIALFSLHSLEIDSELDLFKILESYAKAHPEEYINQDLDVKDEEDSSKKKKVTIRDVLRKIRFLTMTPEDFASYDTSTLLSETEMLAISLNLMSQKAHRPMPEGFSTSRKSRTEGSHDSKTGILKMELYPYSIGHLLETLYVRNIPLSFGIHNNEFSSVSDTIEFFMHSDDDNNLELETLVQLKIDSQNIDVLPLYFEKVHTFTNGQPYIRPNLWGFLIATDIPLRKITDRADANKFINLEIKVNMDELKKLI